jgi:hypothetical protein
MEPKNLHHECLRMMSVIQNRYMDIEDVFDEELTDKQKLEKIRRLNAKIGKITAKYLPG